MEGGRRAADDITVEMGFSVLDLTGLHGPNRSGETMLRIDAEPGTLLDAHVTAQNLIHGALRADNVELKAKLVPGALTIEPLTLHFAGGAARIDAAVENTPSSSAVRFDAGLDGASVTELSGILGIGSLPLAGTMEARAHLRLTGKTLTEAGRSNRGVVILSMRGGTIERKVIEGASTDLRLLFRAPRGSNQIACLLGVVDLRGGIGRIAPLRIRTSDGTIAGAGTFDLRDDMIDVVIASESASTGLFALDVPLRISGPLENPQIAPALGGTGVPANASLNPRDLPPALLTFVRRNPCVEGGGR